MVELLENLKRRIIPGSDDKNEKIRILNLKNIKKCHEKILLFGIARKRKKRWTKKIQEDF